MAHPLIIALVALLLVRDAYGSAIELDQLAHFLGGSRLQAARAAALALYAATALVGAWTWRRTAVCNRRMLRRGANVWALRAHRAVAASRGATLILTAAAIFSLDAVQAARTLVGDRVLLDEGLVVAPALIVMAMGWWALHPVEKRLRDAVLLRRLDQGSSIHAIPGRFQYTWDQIRHGMLATLVPVALILGWSEWVISLIDAKQGQWTWLADPTRATWTAMGLQLAGAAGALVATPMILRFVWDMVPLRTGDVAQRVRAVCSRHRVKVGAALVWRTHGTLLNAAVLGVFPPMRYLLLSDALLEALPEREIEAVTAHEVGHVRRRHLPWLMVALIACFGLPLTGSFAALDWLGAPAPGESSFAHAIEGVVAALGVGAGFALLGFVSRRFEWQADAFAVQHMSGMTTDAQRNRTILATEDAVDAMAGALGRVATLNGMPTHRFGWRHGSIADRQQRIRALAGRPIVKLPIDRVVQRVKLASLAGAIAVAALSAVAPATPAPQRKTAPQANAQAQTLTAAHEEADTRHEK